jgi:SAM-dependent methyltransferase
MRWRELSSDPNSQAVLESRRSAVEQARTDELIRDRIAYLCQLVANKSVLDIGVVEHTMNATESENWLHGHLRRHAAQCLGVDVLETEVGSLREKGFNVVAADVTQSPLPRKFDVVIGGEVLEHLDAPGSFMANCAAMLDAGGRLAITVPNPWYFNVIFKSCFRRYTFIDSADHVAWYDAGTLIELGQRHGFRLDRYAGIAVRNPSTIRAKLFFGIAPVLITMGLAPQLFAKSIIYEFVRV